MKTFLRAVTAILATSRLTRLIVEDEITEPLRNKVSKKALGAASYTLPERIETLVNCPVCMSVWAGAMVATADSFGGRFWQLVLRVGALSEATIALRTILDRVNDDDNQ